MRMKLRNVVVASLICIAFASISLAAAKLSPLRAQGTKIVNAEAEQVNLRGCNLGNWLLLEPWMFGKTIEAKDQADAFAILRERFGDEKLNALMERFRNAWLTQSDFEVI